MRLSLFSGSLLSTLYIALVYAENQSKQRKLVNHDSTHVNGKSTKKSRQDSRYNFYHFSIFHPFHEFLCHPNLFYTTKKNLVKSQLTTFILSILTKFLCNPEFFNMTKKSRQITIFVISLLHGILTTLPKKTLSGFGLKFHWNVLFLLTQCLDITVFLVTFCCHMRCMIFALLDPVAVENL